MKIRVTIDTNETDKNMREHGSLERGVYGCDKNGVYYMWYGSRSDLAEFTDIEIIEHDPPKKEPCDIKNCHVCETETLNSDNSNCGCCTH